MNKAIQAMMIKLRWQHDELCLHGHTIEQALQKITTELEATQLRISQSTTGSGHINPDLEISRLNFITQQYQCQGELQLALKEHESQKQNLNKQILRIKTELKMLQLYTEREADKVLREQLKKEELAIDEWALRPRNSI